MLIIGAVLANRLTEVDDWNVLLVEAGGDETEISDVPLLAAYLQLTQLDWQYKAEPQDTACLGEFLLVFTHNKTLTNNRYIFNISFLFQSFARIENNQVDDYY